MKRILLILYLIGILHLYSWKTEKLEILKFNSVKPKVDTLWNYKYYKSGNLKEMYQEYKKKKNGTYIKYYDTNVKIQRVKYCYKENKLHGPELWFDKNGDTILFGNYLYNKSYGFFLDIQTYQTYCEIRYKNKTLCYFTTFEGKVVELPQINSKLIRVLKDILGQDYELFTDSLNKIRTVSELQNEDLLKAIFIKYGNKILQVSKARYEDNQHSE